MLGRMTSASLPHRPGRRVALAGLAIALGASLTACGSSGSGSGPQAQSTAGGTTLNAVNPFTGTRMAGQPPKNPPLVVKIPETAEANPQIGMSKADMAYEELVEGGITRLGVVYYSKLPGVTGPVRSMRNSDIDIAQPTHGRIVASGAAPSTIRALHKSRVRFYSEGGPGYFRVGNRTAPYNLMVHMKELAGSIKKKTPVPPPYFDFGPASSFSAKTPAKKISIPMSPSRTSQWKYAGGHYINTNGYAPASDQFKPATVLVVQVKEGVAPYKDPAGNSVPITIYHGKGKAYVFHDGKVMKANWHKAGAKTRVKLSTKSGALKLPPGKVFLELEPKTAGQPNFTK